MLTCYSSFFLQYFLRLINLHENPNGFIRTKHPLAIMLILFYKRVKMNMGHCCHSILRPFGEYKNPVYIYAVIPFIKILV